MNNIQNPQYGINPFERKEIVIGSAVAGVVPDRSAGQYIETLEGLGFYIERCDWPILLNVNSQGGGIQVSINARDGLEFTGSFKGLTITHPALNIAGVLTLILYKTPEAKITNQLDNPVTRFQISQRSITNTALQQQIGIFIPPGTRSIKNLQAFAGAITYPGVSAQFVDKTGAIITCPTSLVQQVGTAQVAYTLTPAAIFAQGQVVGTAGIANFNNIFVPSGAAEIVLTANGTGLTQMQASGNWE